MPTQWQVSDGKALCPKNTLSPVSLSPPPLLWSSPFSFSMFSPFFFFLLKLKQEWFWSQVDSLPVCPLWVVEIDKWPNFLNKKKYLFSWWVTDSTIFFCQIKPNRNENEKHVQKWKKKKKIIHIFCQIKKKNNFCTISFHKPQSKDPTQMYETAYSHNICI